MDTPICDFVRRYAESGTLRLHMPGHKGQPVLGPEPLDITEIDGAGRARKAFSITIPQILPTISIILIMKLGNLLSVSTETILLLYKPATYSTADVIGTYVYRYGIENRSYSYAAAVGLFNSIVSLILVVAANRTSKKLSGNGMW